jgi:hypothetical protein
VPESIARRKNQGLMSPWRRRRTWIPLLKNSPAVHTQSNTDAAGKRWHPTPYRILFLALQTIPPARSTKNVPEWGAIQTCNARSNTACGDDGMQKRVFHLKNRLRLLMLIENNLAFQTSFVNPEKQWKSINDLRKRKFYEPPLALAKKRRVLRILTGWKSIY